ncbi:hypothetical protein [Micromonospora sp. C28ISP2-4]|uniref:hypothetical protein n=1 Tax=Micromonospora sp. C28ISP2-4 TaxID=3059523 RepID=UPI00267632D6|nr:hypothetical protein [Micromonospora sp. C28ISP2-4]MDO3686905.1 hypothetical protein [Micromonospora sp. C28ISP2-4]
MLAATAHRTLWFDRHCGAVVPGADDGTGLGPVPKMPAPLMTLFVIGVVVVIRPPAGRQPVPVD